MKLIIKTMALVTAVALLISLTACEISIGGAQKDSKNSSGESTIEIYSHDSDDENKKTLYATGTSDPIAIRKTDSVDGEVVAELNCGDSVKLISSDSTSYYYVQATGSSTKGYVKKVFMTEESGAVCTGEQYYTLNDTKLYDKVGQSFNEQKSVKSGTELVVLAKNSGEYWFVNVKDTSDYGYIKLVDLSKEKPNTKDNSSKEESKAASSSVVSKAEVNSASDNTSNDPHYCGYGEPPSNSDFMVWFVNVKSGYLAIRNAKAFDSSNEIGKVYKGDTVQVIDKNTGIYWYVYSPSEEMYGYVDGKYLLSGDGTPGGAEYDMASVFGEKNYLALRSSPSYDASNEIGKLHTGDMVYYSPTVSYSNYSDTYWYVYSVNYQQFGYVNRNYLRTF